MPALHRLCLWITLVASAAGAAAAGDHAAPAKGKVIEEKQDEVPPPPKARKEPVDPMQTLRDKLAARLNATPSAAAKNPNVVRISTAADAGQATAGTEAAAGHGAAAPRARAAAAPKPQAHAPHWSYEGEGGPDTWGRLKPEFAKCATGTRQSPIDIRDGIRVELDPVAFDYRPSNFRVVDNGHTVQVNVAAGNSIEVTGRRYELVQFHFHRPSEERIEGRQFDMVAHLVHKDPDGRLAVVAVLLDRGSAHPLVQLVWNNLPLEQNVEVPARSAIDLNHLLPTTRRYYTYMGSLTTPPCSEGVLWMVMQQPVTLSAEQIDVFSRLYPMNARPVQQAAGRLIKQSN
jgi:carbonic anhydrase